MRALPRHPLTLAFILIAGATCLALASLTPPGQVPDEPSHIVHAVALSEGHLIGGIGLVKGPSGRDVPVSGVVADPGVFVVISHVRNTADPTPPKVTAEDYQAMRGIVWLGIDQFLAFGPNATYFPIFYVPAAVAVAAARAVGLGPFDAIVAGRFANVVAFVVLGAMTLEIARRGRAMLFCTLATPMTLSLAASFNQDGLMIPAALLAAALTTRDRPRDRLWSALLIAAVATVKPPYIVLVALLLLPFPTRGGTAATTRPWLTRIGIAALILVPVLAWNGWMQATIGSPIWRAAAPAGPLWPGPAGQIFEGTDVAAQARVLLAAPIRLLSLPWAATANGGWLVWQFIGMLGWLNIFLPFALYHLWNAALICAAGADLVAVRTGGSRLAEAALCVIAFVAGVWMIMIVEYLTWTPVGAAVLDGMQGRYFAPLVGLLAAALPRLAIPGARWLAAAAATVPACAAAVGTIVLPRLIVFAYFLR